MLSFARCVCVCVFGCMLHGDQVRFAEKHALKASLITRRPDRETTHSFPRRNKAHALHGERICFRLCFFRYCAVLYKMMMLCSGYDLWIWR